MREIGFIEKWKEGLSMAKRFKRDPGEKVAKKEHIKTEVEKEVEKIAEKVAKEKTEEESKMDFLISKGMQDRPNSLMALTAWEEYKAS